MTPEFGRWVLALDGSTAPDRALIGGKAWSIARMCNLGLPVPPAVVVSTAACAAYREHGALPADLSDELKHAISWLENASQRRFGHGPSPLLVSVRSGAAISMPGMMDTVLNLGMNEASEQAFAEETHNAEFAHDTHRRFLELYAAIVLKATVPPLAASDTSATWLQNIATAAGRDVPRDPFAQLLEAIVAVFESSNSRRARRYRKHHQLPDDLGTAVTIQTMVFGNFDQQSGTGVLFSRNPLTGAPSPYGEYLPCAQGEDVVSGKVTPQALSALQASLPAVAQELLAAAQTLEADSGDVQDIEFTVQQGRLFLLQARAAKRAPLAAVRFAVDMVAEGLIDKTEALRRVAPEQVRTLLQARLASGASDEATRLATGEPACQGVGVGVVVTSADAAEELAARGESAILATQTTSPDDVHGMIACRAVITEQGGSTSHAAVVCRALGVPCVVGCGDDTVARLAGETVTVDGSSGTIFAGRLAVSQPRESDEALLQELIAWSRPLCPIDVLSPAAAQGLKPLDLSQIPGGETPDEFARVIATAKCITGGALNSDAGVVAALEAGVECIVSEYVLPVMLCAIQHADTARENETK